MRRIIRLGDKTSHGGTVVSATSHVTVGGIPVARVGDKCTCPKKGHNNCVIVEGDPNWTVKKTGRVIGETSIYWMSTSPEIFCPNAEHPDQIRIFLGTGANGEHLETFEAHPLEVK